MINYREYIANDIQEKKSLLDVYPKNTEKRMDKYRETLQEIRASYKDQQDKILQFILYKEEKLTPKKNTDVQNKELLELKSRYEHLLKISNESTTFFEKFEFDLLFFDLRHYYEKSIEKNNETIKRMVDIFHNAGIRLRDKDFHTSFYGELYMKKFLENYPEVNAKDYFQTVFWKCPNVYSYILISFKLLIDRYRRALEKSAKKTFELELKASNISGYKEAASAYKRVVQALTKLGEEKEYDLVSACVRGDMDLAVLDYSYEVLESAINGFTINKLNLKDVDSVNAYVAKLLKAKEDFTEYHNYMDQQKLMAYFIKKYKPYVTEEHKKGEKNQPFLDNIKLIQKLEKTAYKNSMKQKLTSPEQELDDKTQAKLFTQQMNLDALYKEYINYDALYFDDLLKKELKLSTTGGDIIFFMLSYPVFSLKLIKKTFKFDDGQTNTRLSELFDLYYQGEHKVLDMAYIFVPVDIPQKLMNGFRFENINVNLESFSEENYDQLMQQFQNITRKIRASHFTLSQDEIKFLVDVERLRKTKKIQTE